MKPLRAPVVAVLILALLALAPAAAAAPPTAADFAADCNADGIVTISGRLNTIGGNGTLTGLCVVVMDEGAVWFMRDATLNGGGDLIIGDAQRNTRVTIARSTIDLVGAVQIAPGCCAGFEPGRSEADATTRVVDSTLRGASVEVSASTAHHRGTVVVRRSTLESTTSLGVSVNASTSAGLGVVVVQDSVLTGAGDADIRTGRRGTTKAQRNTFTVGGTTTITTGINGTCVSAANTPAVACS